MTESGQIKAIVKAAKSGAEKVGVVTENHKRDRFMRKLRAELPADQFDIVDVGQFTKDTVALIVTRKKPVNPASN